MTSLAIKSLLTWKNSTPELRTHKLRPFQSGSYYADILRISPLGLGNSMCVWIQPFPTASREENLLMAVLVWPDAVAAACRQPLSATPATNLCGSTRCHSCAEGSTEAVKNTKLHKGCCGTSVVRPLISRLFLWKVVMVNTRKGQRNRCKTWALRHEPEENILVWHFIYIKFLVSNIRGNP